MSCNTINLTKTCGSDLFSSQIAPVLHFFSCGIKSFAVTAFLELCILSLSWSRVILFPSAPWKIWFYTSPFAQNQSTFVYGGYLPPCQDPINFKSRTQTLGIQLFRPIGRGAQRSTSDNFFFLITTKTMRHVQQLVVQFVSQQCLFFTHC